MGSMSSELLGLEPGAPRPRSLEISSIATFASLRPFEQLRNGAHLHQLQVRVIAVGGGFGYGTAGITHHAVEDVAVMRTLPHMRVVVPADDRDAAAAVRALHAAPGPC